MAILMLDLYGQYLKIKEQIDAAMVRVVESAAFIGGQEVSLFEDKLSDYLLSKYVVSCGNGTDALQIALMALDLKAGDEVILPAFTYPATVEVVALLGLTPVLADVEISTFNMSGKTIESLISKRTKAILPVHLFGHSCDMDGIISFAKEFDLFVIEDNAQSLGAVYNGNAISKRCGTIGDIGCTSFFPSKNLGCFGDGGAIFTQDEFLAERLRMIANHGQREKYKHEIVGCNSRLDAIQAAILSVKIDYLDKYLDARAMAALSYSERLRDLEQKGYLSLPVHLEYSSHGYHQFTVKIHNGRRDKLRRYLSERNIPSMIYYPLPIHKQKAFASISQVRSSLSNSELLCEEVLSLPMHTELTVTEIDFICDRIVEFFR